MGDAGGLDEVGELACRVGQAVADVESGQARLQLDGRFLILGFVLRRDGQQHGEAACERCRYDQSTVFHGPGPLSMDVLTQMRRRHEITRSHRGVCGWWVMDKA